MRCGVTYICAVAVSLAAVLSSARTYACRPCHDIVADTLRPATERRHPERDTVQYMFDDVVDTVKVRNINIDTSRYKSKLARTINDIFSYSPKKVLTEKRVDDRYDGYVVDSVIIVRMPPFDDNAKSRFMRWTYRAANNLHVLTRESRIRKMLMIGPGDRFDISEVTRNEVLIRGQSFIDDVSIVAEPSGIKGHVVVTVYVSDNFSLGGEFEYNGHDDSELSIYENNFLGTGNTLKVTDYFNFPERRFAKYGDISHKFHNFLGTFVEITSTLGYGDRGDYFKVHNKILRPYLKPTDWAGGVNQDFSRSMDDIVSMDSTIRVTRNIVSAWAGASFKVAPKETSVYFNMRYEYRYFIDGPFVNRWVNRYYHNNTSLLFTLGVYREHFYRGNLIYGFGRTEDIPYGFKAELLGGYSWGRYDDIPYVGARAAAGHLTHLGYIYANAQCGSYLMGEYSRYNQMITRLDMLYFTNLLPLKRGYNLRQFMRAGVTIGANMMIGDGQNITFDGDYKLRDISMGDIVGTTRMFISPETVLFSPWHILGFRFSLYSYLDSGTLGFNNNPFKNEFYSAIGLGIRVRNEKLSFSAIQLRFSVMLKGAPAMSSQYLKISHEQRLNGNRFIPGEPDFVKFD